MPRTGGQPRPARSPNVNLAGIMQDTGQHGERASSQRTRSHLPALAPRKEQPPSSQHDRPSRSAPACANRGPRLPHRSRAGCWTCRGRKVKCDESRKCFALLPRSRREQQHGSAESCCPCSSEQSPRCGPCTRLNRDCDWDHRWNFSDATTTTQMRHHNVKTDGNAVWDPSAQSHRTSFPPRCPSDHPPDFAVLTSDDDRERRAVAHKPGTFVVVVTPESFHDLPEYAAPARASSYRGRRTSVRSARGPCGTPRPRCSRSATLPPDPNTVILDQFEQVSAVVASSLSSSEGGCGDDFGADMQRLFITSPPYIPSVVAVPTTPTARQDEHLLQHFRHYIVPRLVQPQSDSMPGIISQGSTRDVLEREAMTFPPLYHAMCAISALHLAYHGQSSLEEAMQHYHQALAASTTPSTTNDLLSDGLFFRHYLLFLYDICIPIESEDGGTDMSAEHLDHLKRIAVQRHLHHQGREPYAYTLWALCQLDMYACLMGSGTCDFVQTIIQNNMLPPLDQQVPCLTTVQAPGAGAFLPHEIHIFPPILRLHEGIILRTAHIAQLAQKFRAEYAHLKHSPIPPRQYAQWTALTAQAQSDLDTFWLHALPSHLTSPDDSPPGLPDRPATTLHTATLLYHTTTLYLHTSMFPHQRPLPRSHTEHHITSILRLATHQVLSSSAHALARRTTVFALFLAGATSPRADAKLQAMDLLRALEPAGIGQNTLRTRQLLAQVCEEQRRACDRGAGIDAVEWIAVAAEMGLWGVLGNCGL